MVSVKNQNLKTRVCFLPVAGKEDPGQMLRMQGVARGPFEVLSGVHARFFAGTRTCLRFRPDLLHFDWIDRYLYGRTTLISRVKMAVFWLDVQLVTGVFRRPIVWTLHNLRSHEPTSSSVRIARLQRYFARRATLIRVFSQGAVTRAAQTLAVPEGKIRVVPEGDFTAYYPNTESPASARAALGLAPGDFVLLWLGSIRPYKGLHELIEVFRKIARPDWRLVIAGKPYVADYAVEIAALAKEDSRIQLHPRFIAENELQVFYNAADGVVLPFAEVENSGSVCVAMGFHKPVVAPAMGVIGERLRHQPELVYPPGGLAAAVQKLAALPAARREAIGRDNFAEVTGYRWENLATVFAELAVAR